MIDIEKRRHLLSSERHKTDQRSGFSYAADLAYDPKSWVAGVWTPKSVNGRSAPTSVRRFGEAASFQPRSQSGLRLEELAVGVWTPKSGNGQLQLLT
ncbi:hypothetical protein CXF70_02790 [Planomicrobium sp. MB-3u-38]|nr:hypothetical protein CXF70_02790 [Planomicrobium sp. MB-3u-38]